MSRSTAILLCAALLSALGAARAQSPQTDFIGDRNSAVDRTTQVAEQPKTERQGRDVTAFTRQCTHVVGIAPYCACVASRVPAGLTFEQYFIVLGRSRQANGYDGLQPAVRQAYDAMPRIRDECAARAGAMP